MEKVINFDNDPWMLGEDIPDMDFQFSQIWLSSFVNNLQKTAGINYSKILCIYHGYNLKFYYGEKDSDNFAKHLLTRMQEDLSFGHTINSEIRRYSDELKKLAQKIELAYLANLSHEELATFYQELDELHTTLYTWGWLPNAVDMFHGNFTAYLKDLLTSKLPSEEVNPALVALSVGTEKSVIDKEHDSFLKIIALVQDGAPTETVDRALQEHCDNHFYLKHLWIGKEGVYDLAYYKEEVEKYLSTGKQAKEELTKRNEEFQENLRKREALLGKLNLTETDKELFDIYAEFAVTKVYRRDAQLFWAYKMDFVFDELAKRLGIPVMSVRFMFPWEIDTALKDDQLDEALKAEVAKRTEHCVYFASKGIDRIFVGEEATVIEKELEEDDLGEVKELRGQTACLGKVTGAVRIVNNIADMAKMNQGDILVSIATNPDIVPAMKKAGAIVTEQGGITSHAAIVSRELGTPCVIGTKIATKVLKDGDMIEVDANSGIVRVI